MADEVMSVRSTEAREQWNAFDYRSKANLLRVVRESGAAFLELVEQPEHWEAPTACAGWQVRDMVGHMVDVNEGYIEGFAIARASRQMPEPYGLRVMGKRLDERARAFRGTPQQEMVQRLRESMDKVFALFEALSDEEWTGMQVPHTYMGPLPPCIYPAFQLMDYGVHAWDIREGLGMHHGLSADVADFLVPFMFILWQATTDAERAAAFSGTVGIRVSGRNGDTWRVTADGNGYSYEQGPVEDLPLRFEFDPASLVLTAFGRIRGGTAYGDAEMANQYRGLFFSI